MAKTRDIRQGGRLQPRRADRQLWFSFPPHTASPDGPSRPRGPGRPSRASGYWIFRLLTTSRTPETSYAICVARALMAAFSTLPVR